ncbi:hypothetical protein AYO21_06282 [Fonsecaea monophora]|uniref:Uncharacterized protein n=1 Tax=Fonsecaea monophora TaxID=254056 RepID=A0A177F5F7_9EURO|nr:hypothetical protein AYO21_06282 [Fonsecaea monophora]OAG39454.1 hypothetical protein AYO21_06282 [Fonsecaea monophora]
MSLVRQYWFGSLMVDVTCDSIPQEPLTWTRDESQDHTYVAFTYIPPRWLSDMCITVSMTPAAPLRFQRSHLNLDLRIVDCLSSCDVQGLQKMFAQGLAHPFDLIPPRQVDAGDFSYFQQPSSVLEMASTNQDSDEAEQMLAVLMENQAYEKRDAIDSVIDRGVDLSDILNATPYQRHSILLILYATGPRAFAHDFVRRQVGLLEYYDMTPANSWLLRTIARSEPGFRSKLVCEQQELCGQPNGNNCKKTGPDICLQTQLKDMREADAEERDLYLSTLCAGGPAAELDALLWYPGELPELNPKHEGGRFLRRYLEISAAFGNSPVFRRLIHAGADTTSRQYHLWNVITGNCNVTCYFNTFGDQIKLRSDMAEMLLPDASPSLASCLTPLMPYLMVPATSRASYSQSHYLTSIPRIPTARMPGGLAMRYTPYYIIGLYGPFPAEDNIPRLLVAEGFSRRAVSATLLGAAVLHGDQTILATVLSENSELEWEDINGLTPLMMAIILRSFESARKLLLHGADAERINSHGFSARQLIFKLRDLCEEDEEEYMQSLREELCEDVSFFIDTVFPSKRDYRGTFEEFNDAIDLLGFDDKDEQTQVDATTQVIPKRLGKLYLLSDHTHVLICAQKL